jgi:hypothetical protein
MVVGETKDELFHAEAERDWPWGVLQTDWQEFKSATHLAIFPAILSRDKSRDIIAGNVAAREKIS